MKITQEIFACNQVRKQTDRGKNITGLAEMRENDVKYLLQLRVSVEHR